MLNIQLFRFFKKSMAEHCNWAKLFEIQPKGVEKWNGAHTSGLGSGRGIINRECTVQNYDIITEKCPFWGFSFYF